MGQLALRARYLVHRTRRIRFANLLEFARQVRPVSAAPVPVIIADMLWCALRYEMGFRDYAVWDIRTLSGRERATWMTHPKSYRLTATLDDRAASARLSDKSRFYAEFDDVLGREWLDLRSADAERLADLLRRHPRLVAKPVDGTGGSDVTVVSTTGVTDVLAFRDELVASGRVLIEGLIVQHEDLGALYRDSINTVRLITYLAPGDRFHLIAAVLRIGNGGVIDNFAGGGMFTLLDDSGVALYPGVDKNSRVYPVHPISGASIAGFAIPCFAEAVELVETLSRRIPEVPYIGWDVAITNDGPVIIEANHNSSVFQMKPSVSGIRTGLLGRYRDAIGSEIVDSRRGRRQSRIAFR